MKERPINLNKKPNSVQLPVYAQFITSTKLHVATRAMGNRKTSEFFIAAMVQVT